MPFFKCICFMQICHFMSISSLGKHLNFCIIVNFSVNVRGTDNSKEIKGDHLWAIALSKTDHKIFVGQWWTTRIETVPCPNYTSWGCLLSGYSPDVSGQPSAFTLGPQNSWTSQTPASASSKVLAYVRFPWSNGGLVRVPSISHRRTLVIRQITWDVCFNRRKLEKDKSIFNFFSLSVTS